MLWCWIDMQKVGSLSVPVWWSSPSEAGVPPWTHLLTAPGCSRMIVRVRKLSSRVGYAHSSGLTLRIVMLPYLLGSRLGLLSIVSFI
jgi:hypothetical protein